MSVELLREVLPPIHRNRLHLSGFSSRVCIDLEWDEDTGELELIGVGNRDVLVQFWWRELDGAQRAQVGAEIILLVLRVPVVYQNADSDIRKLRANGIMVDPRMHYRLDDTMLAHSVLHCEDGHALKCRGGCTYLVDRCCLKRTYGRLPTYAHLQHGTPSERELYNACDVIETLWVWEGIKAELAQDPAAERVYREERLALLPYIIEDEERGLRVNQALVYPLRDEYEKRMRQAANMAHAYLQRPFNLGSPDQLKHIVYGIEGFPVQHHKKTDAPTVDKDALAVLRRMVLTEWDPDEEPTFFDAMKNIEEGGNAILEARYLSYGAQQTLSHYLDHCFVWEGEHIAGVRDRIYPETRQHVQTSGRHSIVGPALQQLKGKVERMIHPDVGHRWLGWDWSNIETWLLGVLAGDKLILEAKAQGWDTHTLNFCDITGTPYPPVLTKALHTAPECEAWRAALRWQGEDDIRRVFAKRFVYRLHYRGQAANAGDIPGARQLRFDATRLVEASERYLAKHHWIVEWWKGIESQVDKHGVVYAFDGMPRRLTSSDHANARYRAACNHPMQAGVAHIYNRTRLLLHTTLPWLTFAYGKHDSQWWQCPEGRREEAWVFIKPVVERQVRINGMAVSFPASFKERRPE